MSLQHAPITKGFLILLTTLTLLVSISSHQPHFSIPLYPHILRDHQYYRFFTSQFVFTSSAELFLATVLLINVSPQVERRFGCWKFLSFLVSTICLTAVFEFPILTILHRFWGINELPPGPFVILHALIYQYYRIIPPMVYVKCFGYRLTNKMPMYFMCCNLMGSNPPTTPLLSLFGLLLLGPLYRSTWLPTPLLLHQWRIPLPINNPSSASFSSTAASSSSSSSTPGARGRAEIGGGWISSTLFPSVSQQVSLLAGFGEQYRIALRAAENESSSSSNNNNGGSNNNNNVGNGGGGLQARMQRAMANRLAAVTANTTNAARNNNTTPTTGGVGAGTITQGTPGTTSGTNPMDRFLLRSRAAVTTTGGGGTGGGSGVGSGSGGGSEEMVNEERVRSLHSVFPNASRAAVEDSLRNGGGDVNRAVETLLNTTSS